MSDLNDHDLRPTFEEVTEALSVVRQSDDGNRWAAGDLTSRWLDAVVEGEKGHELGRLARASGYSQAGLRERYDCSVYWPEKQRRFDCAWSYYNRARRGVKLPEAVKRLKGLEDNPMSLDEFAKECGTSTLDKPKPPAPTLRDALLAIDAAIEDVTDEYWPLGSVFEEVYQAKKLILAAIKKDDDIHRAEVSEEKVQE